MLCSRQKRGNGREGGGGRGESVGKERGDGGRGGRRARRFCAQSYSETFEHLFHESAYYVRRRGGCRANRPPNRRGVRARDECPRDLSKCACTRHRLEKGSSPAFVQKGIARRRGPTFRLQPPRPANQPLFLSLSLSPFLASTLLRVSRRTYRRSFSPLLPNEPYDSRTIIYTSTTNRSTIPCLTQDKVGSRTFVRIESTPLDREVFSKFRRMHYRCASSRKAKFHLGERGEGGGGREVGRVELLIEDGGKICGAEARAFASVLPAALNSFTSPTITTTATTGTREKIYGHANYPLKLRETSSPPLPPFCRHCAQLSKFGP